MASTERRPVEGVRPPCYWEWRIEERRAAAQMDRPDSPEPMIPREKLFIHPDSDSEPEDVTCPRNRRTLATSYNTVDFVCARERGTSEVRTVDPMYGTNQLLSRDMLSEKLIVLGNVDKVFCSAWLCHRRLIFGTKCSKLMLYNVNSNELDSVPLMCGRRARTRYQYSRAGIHSLHVNPSHTLMATVGRDTRDIAIYRLPNLEPVCIGELHTDRSVNLCWLSDEFLVSGSSDAQLAMWRVQTDDDLDLSQPSTSSDNAETQRYIAPIAVKLCKPAQKIRVINFNPVWKEIVALTLEGYVHVFDAATLQQKMSVRLSSSQEFVCFATHESQTYAIGCKTYTQLMDARTLQPINKLLFRPYNNCGILSLGFRGDILNVGTGYGVLLFYDIRRVKFVRNPDQTANVLLKTIRGRLYADDQETEYTQYPPSIYSHSYDPSGTRIFTGGGPLSSMYRGNYAAIWQ